MAGFLSQGTLAAPSRSGRCGAVSASAHTHIHTQRFKRVKQDSDAVSWLQSLVVCPSVFFCCRRNSVVHIFRSGCRFPCSSFGSDCLPNKSRPVMIYDYLDKWLTERWRVMETPLSYEIHRTHHVDFSGHLNLSAAPPPPPHPSPARTG